MKKIFLSITASVLCSIALVSAQTAETVKVTYGSGGGRGGGRMGAMKTVLTISGDQCKIGREIDTVALIKENPEAAEWINAQRQSGQRGVSETQYIDYKKMMYYSVAELPNGETLATEQPFTFDTDLVIEESDEEICGYKCKVATAIINTNTIKYWFTDQAGVKGTVQPAASLPQGLVLMVSRNGNIGLKAEKIEKLPGTDSKMIPSFSAVLDASMYRFRINNAGVITVPVFNDEYLGMAESNAPKSVSELKSNTVYRVGGGTVIIKKVKLPESSKGWNIFAQVVQKADKDAYDRTGSVFVIPTAKELSYLNALIEGLNTTPAFVDNKGSQYPSIISTENYDIPVELMRFFTSFGVGGYNYHKVPGQVWHDSVVYHQDVTHLAPLLEGEVWVGAYIGNWVKDAHKLSLTLKYHPGGGGRGERVVVPVFNSVNLMEQDGQEYPGFLGHDSLRVTINVPENIKGAQLVYLTSGHGGWGGGDEFNQKENTILLDGEKIFNFIPWREDCASYRDRNPASGNFSNGLSSSDLSRSNWCPGTVTNPVYVPLGDLPKGEHRIAVTIPQGEPQGGSFSYWCLSGVIVGEAVDQLEDMPNPAVLEKPAKKADRKKRK